MRVQLTARAAGVATAHEEDGPFAATPTSFPAYAFLTLSRFDLIILNEWAGRQGLGLLRHGRKVCVVQIHGFC